MPCPLDSNTGVVGLVGQFLLSFWRKVHLSSTSLHALSKYHIIQVTGSELIAKYPLGSQEMPHINCLVKAPLGYHQGSTLNA